MKAKITAEDLFAYISPSICVPGGQIFLLVLTQMQKILEERGCTDNVQLHSDVYAPVADQIGKTRAAVSKAVERAVDDIWMNGSNGSLCRIIGRSLAEKPFPKEFILYCTHFLISGEPYHKKISMEYHTNTK